MYWRITPIAMLSIEPEGLFMGLGIYMGDGMYVTLPYSGYAGKWHPAR